MWWNESRSAERERLREKETRGEQEEGRIEKTTNGAKEKVRSASLLKQLRPGRDSL